MNEFYKHDADCDMPGTNQHMLSMYTNTCKVQKQVEISNVSLAVRRVTEEERSGGAQRASRVLATLYFLT